MIATLPRIVRNKEIMLRFLEGQSLETIAEITDLEPQTVRNILNSDTIKPELLRLQGELGKDIVQKVKARSHAALETVTDVMNGELFSELRFKAASKLLDLNPDLKPKQDEVAGAIGAGLGEYIIRELAKRKKESEGYELRSSSGNDRGADFAEAAVIEGAGEKCRHDPLCISGGGIALEGTILASGGSHGGSATKYSAPTDGGDKWGVETDAGGGEAVGQGGTTWKIWKSEAK